MPLKITDLAPGDRVVLNCPKSRVQQKREAAFEGVFDSVASSMADRGDRIDILAGSSTAEFLNCGQPWARFQIGLIGGCELVACFAVEPDGTLRDEEGRRIFIERRLPRPAQG